MNTGQIIKTFTSKSEKNVVLRYPTMEDLEQLLEFINELSKEDTFITFSGETITREEEEKFLKSTLEKMRKGDQIMLLAFIRNHLIGNCGIERDFDAKKRSSHIGIVGISLKKAYRNDGIGFRMLKTLIDLSYEMKNLRFLRLDVYSVNEKAFKLYQKMGFIEYGRLPKGIRYKNELVDKIEMYKSFR